MKHIAIVLVFALIGGTALLAQEIQVSRQNKTIAVLAEDSVTVDPEVATITIGFNNYAPRNDSVFQANVQASNQITKALLGANVPKENIETAALRLGRVEPEDKWTAEMKKERQFEASQSWKIRVPASQAHTVVDVATRAGANDIEGVTWGVADPVALQARASGAALSKARAIAEQMARGLNSKLGDLVYASNKPPEDTDRFTEAFWRRTSTVEVQGGERLPNVGLFPQRVRSAATVYAVFAIE
jgi:uncharacterized protein YggE